MPNDLEARMTLIEAAQEVYSAQVHELQAWRRRDEPRIANLVTAQQIANEVREALDAAGRRRWTLLQKTGAIITGTIVTAAAIADLTTRLIG